MVLATRSKTAKENKVETPDIESVETIKKSRSLKQKENTLVSNDKTVLKRKSLSNEKTASKRKSLSIEKTALKRKSLSIEKTALKRKSLKEEEPKKKLLKSNGQIRQEGNPNVTAFCKNLSFLVTEDDLKKFFKNSISARIIINRNGLSKGYGFVDFSTQEDLEEALKIKNPELQGRVMLIKKAVKDFKDQEKSNLSQTTLYMKGETKNLTEETLQFDGIVEVRILKKFCYVEFESHDAAEKVYESAKNGLNIDGNVFEVSYAISRGGRKHDGSKKEKTEQN